MLGEIEELDILFENHAIFMYNCYQFLNPDLLT